MRKLLLISLFAGCSVLLVAQEDMLLETLTSLAVENDNERGTLDLQETIQELLQNPVNLNSCNEQKLLDCGLFTPYQVFGILKHLQDYGPFFSIYELATIPGFKKSFLVNIQYLVVFEEEESPNKKHKNSKGMVLTNIQQKFPESKAYLSNDSIQPAFPGSPFKISSRFKYEIGKNITLGVAYEKDAGERMFQNKKPEHTTGYFRYAPGKILKNLTLGNFGIHTGIGLVHGLGFNSNGNGVQLNGFRTSWSKPKASTAEYNYYRGVLAEIGIKKWSCTGFYSCKLEDISLFGMKDSNQTNNLLEAKRETGLHRTASELNGRDLAWQHAAGISLNRNHLHVNYGISASGSKMKTTKVLRDSVPFITKAKNTSGNLSVYAIAYGEKFEVYGEYAINEELTPALLIGGNIELNPALSMYSSFRYYNPDFTSQIPGAYGTGSEINNEIGLNTGLLIIPFRNAKIMLDNDVCYFPAASYYLSTPGFNYRSKVEFTYKFKGGQEITAKYSIKSREVDALRNSPGTKITTIKTREQWRLHYSYVVTENFTLSGRTALAVSGKKDYGFLMYQQVKVKSSDWLSMTYRILLFDIDSWDNRIYCYEPGLRYSFLFPSYYRTGLKNTLVISSKFSRWISLRCRLGHIHYSDKWETGSGVEIRDGDQVFDIEFQLQLTF